jgi:Fe-S-cluster-containing hydrogenase component 2
MESDELEMVLNHLEKETLVKMCLDLINAIEQLDGKLECARWLCKSCKNCKLVCLKQKIDDQFYEKYGMPDECKLYEDEDKVSK